MPGTDRSLGPAPNADISDPVADEPGAAPVEGPIATITLNRPAAFNAIDLAIASKLEQLSAAVEASDEIRVLVIEAKAAPSVRRRPADHRRRRPRPIHRRRWSANCCTITTPSSATLRRMPKIVLASVHGSAAGAGMSLAFVATSASRRKRPASPRPTRKLVCHPMAAAPPAWLPRSAPRRALADLSRRGRLFGRPGL